MDLRSNYPFWLLDQGIIRSYPSLPHDMHADVAVMGAGISGALSAWHLCKAGMKVIVVDKRHVGLGSTAASTALLQYEIDTPLVDLIKKVGARNASESYLKCLKSIGDLGAICKDLPQAGFIRRPSLQYASFKKDVRSLQQEFRARKKIGISLQWLEREAIAAKFGFEKDAALLSRDAAEVRVYSLTHALLNDCKRQDIQVFDHTKIEAVHEDRRGVDLLTSDGKKIRSRKLVVACGYESGKYLPRQVETLRSTYAIVSEPFANRHLWHRNALIWETARPYLYLRTTPDNRILVGGKDDDFSDPDMRERNLPAKVKSLEVAFRKLFPGIRFRTDFRWAGVFGSTKDGLPYIGTLPHRPHTYFALGFGGNGIIFSVLAAQIITGLIGGRKEEGIRLFGFTR